MSRRRKNGGVSGLLFVVLLVAAAGCAPITTGDVDDFVAVTGVDRDPWPRHLTSGDLPSPSSSLQKILGHAKVSMTEKYAHLSPDYLRFEIEKTASPRVTDTTVAQSGVESVEQSVSMRNAGVAQRQSN